MLKGLSVTSGALFATVPWPLVKFAFRFVLTFVTVVMLSLLNLAFLWQEHSYNSIQSRLLGD